MLDKLIKFLGRIFFLVAFLLMIFAVADWFLRLWGWKFSWLPYGPGRMLEFAAILMIVVIAFLLRQIRDSLLK